MASVITREEKKKKSNDSKWEGVRCHLQATKVDCATFVKEEIMKSHQLTVYPDRAAYFTGLCVTTESDDVHVGSSFDAIVFAMAELYIEYLDKFRKGRDKFVQLQLSWMKFQEKLLNHHGQHNNDTETKAIRELLVKQSNQGIGDPAIVAITILITRSVFNFMQQQVVAFKEQQLRSTESGVSEPKQANKEPPDEVEESFVFADEASLHRMGGFALHSAIKEYCSQLDQRPYEFLCSLQMASEVKKALPTNLLVLDKGGLTYMKKEMIGYLAMLYKKMQEKSNEKFINLHGENFMKVLENIILDDPQLYSTFKFASREARGCANQSDIDEEELLRLLYSSITKKIIHSHGNEIISNKTLLSGQPIDVPVMLREKLKILATKEQK